MNFARDVLAPLRHLTGRRLKESRDARWEAEDLGLDGVRLTVTFPAAALSTNLQKDLPAAPFFGLAFAYWHQRRTGRPTRFRAQVEGAVPDTAHARRARFVLHELASALPLRFEIDAKLQLPLPPGLTMNRAAAPRDTATRRGPLSEAALERRIVGTPALLDDFVARIAPITSFQRQLPLGLFEGPVAIGNEFFPRGAAQADMWGTSPDGRVLHLFELKARNNAHMGILPEALVYARLLHHVRQRHIAGAGDGLEATRRAERIIMWLVAPEYHPLVVADGDSPIRWINEGMADDSVELRVLPFDLADDGAIKWRPEGVRSSLA